MGGKDAGALMPAAAPNETRMPPVDAWTTSIRPSPSRSTISTPGPDRGRFRVPGQVPIVSQPPPVSFE
jgi:hypothetical protein